MSFFDLCIRRPIFAGVLNAILLVIGAIAYDRLALREYPDVNEPVVSVSTRWRGAAAEIVESEITARLEDSLAGIEGIDFIKSASRAESSRISIRFRPTRNIDDAAADVRDRVARVRARLPAEADDPVIAKEEADAQPMLWVSFASDRDSPLQISDYLDRFVKPRLETLPGISEIRIFGERRPAMRIWLDPLRLAAHNLTPADIESALRRQNLELPAGSLESDRREFSVIADTALATPEAFANIPLVAGTGGELRLGDVAQVELGPYDDRVRARLDGQPAVTLGIVRQSTANPLEISRSLRARLPEIEAALPAGMRAIIAYDSADFIGDSLDNVYRALGEALLLVMLTVLLFLGSWRAALIPLIAIPISLLGAVALMAALGFSLNTLTMLAFVLAIGLVVDDAIVVTENIDRHIQDGLAPLAAAKKGSREIGFAILAMTLTLVAVYTPLAFETGRTGKFFVEFALTLAGAVLVSGFVALTLSPMMAARLLRRRKGGGLALRLAGLGARLGDNLRDAYGRSLARRLDRPWRTILFLLPLGALLLWLFLGLKNEIAPSEDRNVVFLSGSTAEGASPAYTYGYADRVEKIALGPGNLFGPGLNHLFVLAASNNASSLSATFRLAPREDRDFAAADLATDLRRELSRLPGLTASVSLPPPLGQSFSSKAVELVLLGTGDATELGAVAEATLAAARGDPRLRDVDIDLRIAKPEFRIAVDRDRAAALGLDPATIAATLETLLAGRDVTEFKRDGKTYDVVLRIEREDRRLPDQLRGLYLRTERGAMVPLSGMIKLAANTAPLERIRWNRLPAVTISANLAPGVTPDLGLSALLAHAKTVGGDGIAFDYAGQSRTLREIGSSGRNAFLLALLFIYLLLAAQFESLRDPLIVMMTVPLAILGALIAMRLTGGSLNVYSEVGLVTLIGLIAKHGILIVDFANRQCDRGESRRDAALAAARLRLRPILMTSIAMILGALPLILGEGSGAEARRAIGWVIFGGLTFGSLFTLFAVPVAYALFSRRVSRIEARMPAASKPNVTVSDIQESSLPKA